MTDPTLRLAASDILERNWRGRHTVPAGGLYPHQWSWDSAFIAFGLRHLSARRAQQELESLFAAQWQDGRLPQIVFSTGLDDDAYFPGPRFWRSGDLPEAPAVPTAGLIQPPNHAWAVWAVHRSDPQESRRTGFLERTYPVLHRWHEYLRTRRDRGGSGLLAAVHPWETGMDNSPAWDLPLSGVPRHDLELTRPDLRHADASERPSNAEYGRYVYLADRYRRAACDDADADFPFLVEDVGMNALWCLSETSLAEIASELGADPFPHHRRARAIAEALHGLFDAEAGMYLARDIRTGERLAPRSVAGLLPLLLPGLPTAQQLLATLRGPGFRLGETVMVPSYDLTRPDADPAAYWRGPAWFNTTWMLMRSLRGLGAYAEADVLRQTMSRLALTHAFPEYVDPWTGSPHGTRLFSWTAALVLDAETDPEDTP